MVTAVRAGDVPRSQTWCKLLLYGNAGTGKTTASARLERPLIVESDPHAISVIRSTNPDAEVVLVQSSADVNEVVALLRGGTSTPTGLRVTWPGVKWRPGEKPPAGADARYKVLPRHATYRSVVFDSVGDVQRRMVQECVDGSASKDIASLHDYGVVVQKTIKLCNDLRDLPVHVVLLFHAEEVVVEDKRYIRPAIVGKRLPNILSGFVNVVAYLFKKEGAVTADGKPGRSKYLALTDGSEKWMTKAHAALPPMCSADLQRWINLMVDYKHAAPLIDMSDEVPAEEIPDADTLAQPEPEPAEHGPDELDVEHEKSQDDPDAAEVVRDAQERAAEKAKESKPVVVTGRRK